MAVLTNKVIVIIYIYIEEWKIRAAVDSKCPDSPDTRTLFSLAFVVP